MTRQQMHLTMPPARHTRRVLERARGLAILGAGLAALTACTQHAITDINAPTSFPKTYAGLEQAFTGAAGASIRGDVGTYALDLSSFSRDVGEFLAAAPQSLTELTGEQALPPGSSSEWTDYFTTIKGIDTVQAALPTLTNGQALTQDTIATLWAQLETFKGLYYEYVAEAHDTNGVPINAVGGPTAANSVAPILCLPSAWAEIVAILDSAVDSLRAVPAATPLVSGLLPTGYNLVSDNSTHWLDFALAVRATAHLQYAYAIARGAAGDGAGAPTLTSPGTPDVNQLDSAAADFDTLQAHGLLYSDADLTAVGKVGGDPGVYLEFSTVSGDVTDPLGASAPQLFALLGEVAQIDTLHDLRFLAKFGHGALPTTEYDGGLVPANLIGSDWQYGGGTETSAYGLSGNLPIVRNLQLHLLNAEVQLGLGNYTQALSIINTVRTTAGGLAASTITPDYADVRDLLLQELAVSLVLETGDHLIAIRNYGTVLRDLTTWNNYGGDLHTAVFPTPLAEASARNNNITPVCTDPVTPASVVPATLRTRRTVGRAGL
jgi:hypothetical protein